MVFLFSCSKINSSTEQTEANFPSAIFQSMLVFVQQLSGDILFSTFIHHKWNFIVRIGDWKDNSFSQWNFIIGYEQNQYEYYSQWFSWINLSTYEIKYLIGWFSVFIVSWDIFTSCCINIYKYKRQVKISHNKHYTLNCLIRDLLVLSKATIKLI